MLTSGIAFSLPPGAELAAGQSVDSAAGYFDGDDFRVTFDVGKFGEDLDSLDAEAEFSSSVVRIAGLEAKQVSFVPSDEPFGWARVAQVALGGGKTLTMRVSCVDKDTCALADDVFGSIALGEA